MSISKKILVLFGGMSKERQISLETGKQVAKELKKNKYKVKLIEPDKDLVSNIKTYKPDIIFNALHGQFGEDGYMQTILESIGIPYTHSGILASAKAMDKLISKKLFNKHKISTPKYIQYKFDKSKKELNKIIVNTIGFPLVIKPINEGSSVNVFICTRKNFYEKINLLRAYKEIILEEFIPGQEIQASIIGKRKLGAVELVPKREFYDYKAKYSLKAKTEHIIPPKISKKNYNKLMNITLKTHRLFGCRGVTRADFKFYRNTFYLLEINTQPGMTRLSLVPEIANYNGVSFINLIKLILKDASTNK
jgi:D-alanine-D-alanine ligase